MVGRAVVEALRFGASGGAALGLGMFAVIVVQDDASLPMPVMAVLAGAAEAALAGASVGFAVAYAALLTAGIAADVVGRGAPRRVRTTGAVATLSATTIAVGALGTAVWGVDALSPGGWLLFGSATYGAAIGWFRVPAILAG